jgi:hypothetical protein
LAIAREIGKFYYQNPRGNLNAKQSYHLFPTAYEHQHHGKDKDLDAKNLLSQIWRQRVFLARHKMKQSYATQQKRHRHGEVVCYPLLNTPPMPQQ